MAYPKSKVSPELEERFRNPTLRPCVYSEIVRLKPANVTDELMAGALGRVCLTEASRALYEQKYSIDAPLLASVCNERTNISIDDQTAALDSVCGPILADVSIPTIDSRWTVLLALLSSSEANKKLMASGVVGTRRALYENVPAKLASSRSISEGRARRVIWVTLLGLGETPEAKAYLFARCSNQSVESVEVNFALDDLCLWRQAYPEQPLHGIIENGADMLSRDIDASTPRAWEIAVAVVGRRLQTNPHESWSELCADTSHPTDDGTEVWASSR
jgi:hypothetical protein